MTAPLGSSVPPVPPLMPEPNDTAALPQETIRRKRDGQVLTPAEIQNFVTGLVAGRITGEQAAAFLMAAFLRGLDADETVALTRAMTRSGTVLDWPDMPGPVLDKHSTGGIGDNVSLMLAPAIAACGGYVPMISGRGLGHTGGTLDKLESIPGYAIQQSLARFREVVGLAGCAIVGQTAELAPADKMLYAIRDVTATVESISLITASILSKKLAAGLGALVMDVKAGSGAFMTREAEARELAGTLVTVARGAGLPVAALITDMNEPLASAAGNAVEVRNAVDYLTGARRDPRLHRVVLALGAEMLVLGGLADDRDVGRDRIAAALASGAAAERFGRMVAALGGPTDFVERPEAHLPAAPVVLDVAAGPGSVMAIDGRAIGLAVVALGGGRTRPADPVDPAVGFSDLAPIGADTRARPIGIVHARSQEAAQAAAATLREAYLIGRVAPPNADPVIGIIAEERV